tara:strand:- start:129 stop:1226 length:1098 start_codon:yes stop_codon:yes gene_type:complete
MKVSLTKRFLKVYITMGRTFGTWLSFIFLGIFLLVLRIVVTFFMLLDYVFFPSLINKKIKKPIVIVGNPRSGTTFLHRYLIRNKVGAGSELWQLIYTSVILQKMIKPILPIMEAVSPTKYHATEAHKTSLSSIETDDASMLFRFFDGFFLYGFFLTWSKEDLFNWVDPNIRDNSNRDFKWFESMWKRTLKYHNKNRMIAKLFSVSANCPKFLDKFGDGKILYMVRDPLSVIPSGLSLVTGVLDKKFNFWSMPLEKRQQFIDKLYDALKELLLRFHDDWENGKIDKSRVMIVRFDRMMGNFDDLMKDILKFLDFKPSEDFLNDILETSRKQKEFKSSHNYNLKKFGLTEEKIKKDCEKIYNTFLSE